MDKELTYTDLYADLVRAQSESLPENYFTLSKFCSDTKLSGWMARKRLVDLVDSGTLSTKLARIDGNSRRIWWFNQ